MIDPKLIRYDIDNLAKKLSRRQCLIDINKFRQQENNRKILQIDTEKLQAQHHVKSKELYYAKLNGENTELIFQEINLLKHRLSITKKKLSTLKNIMHKDMSLLPNIPDDNVPDGINENDNIEVLRWGELRKYDFSIRNHVELGTLLINEIDFKHAAKIAGARFAVLRGQIARLHRALIQFMLDLHIEEHGYQEYYLPYLVNKTALYNTGQLPKFSEGLFHVQSTHNSKINNYALIPTAEVPLINMVYNKIISEDVLPIKMVAHTPCFRAESVSYGHDTNGLIRMHQFDKVEIVQIIQPEYSAHALEEITNHAEKVLQKLNLPYRKMLLCTGNIGFTASKTYDLEVFLPGQQSYQEISSCSNVRDFQARRMKARYRNKKNKQLTLLHTLNGSGLAVGRTLIAILENYQLKNGNIKIPSILKDYMKGLTYIG